jgi:hypothetical protein
MTGIDGFSVFFGGLGILMLALSPFAKPTDGYQEPLNPNGLVPLEEQELSRQETEYNRNPRARVAKGGIALIVAAILMQFFRIF